MARYRRRAGLLSSAEEQQASTLLVEGSNPSGGTVLQSLSRAALARVLASSEPARIARTAASTSRAASMRNAEPTDLDRRSRHGKPVAQKVLAELRAHSGSPAMAIGADHLALRDLQRDRAPRSRRGADSSRDRELLVDPRQVVEVQHDRVGLAAVDARMGFQVVDQAQPIRVPVPCLQFVQSLAGDRHVADIRTYVRHWLED